MAEGVPARLTPGRGAEVRAGPWEPRFWCSRLWPGGADGPSPASCSGASAAALILAGLMVPARFGRCTGMDAPGARFQGHHAHLPGLMYFGMITPIGLLQARVRTDAVNRPGGRKLLGCSEARSRAVSDGTPVLSRRGYPWQVQAWQASCGRSAGPKEVVAPAHHHRDGADRGPLSSSPRDPCWHRSSTPSSKRGVTGRAQKPQS